MGDIKAIERLLPLSEASFYILVMLDEPSHGYAVMQAVASATGDRVQVGPGTLYGAFSALENERLIEMMSVQNRRKSYVLTERGRQAVLLQLERLDLMMRTARDRSFDLGRQEDR